VPSALARPDLLACLPGAIGSAQSAAVTAAVAGFGDMHLNLLRCSKVLLQCNKRPICVAGPGGSGRNGDLAMVPAREVRTVDRGNER